jgi:hypothetical protein
VQSGCARIAIRCHAAEVEHAEAAVVEHQEGAGLRIGVQQAA